MGAVPLLPARPWPRAPETWAGGVGCLWGPPTPGGALPPLQAAGRCAGWRQMCQGCCSPSPASPLGASPRPRCASPQDLALGEGRVAQSKCRWLRVLVVEDANVGRCPPTSSGPLHISQTLWAWSFPAAGPHLSAVLDPTALSSPGCALDPNWAEPLQRVRLWGQRGGRAAHGTTWAPAARPPPPLPFGRSSPAPVPREAPASLGRARGQPVLLQSR